MTVPAPLQPAVTLTLTGTTIEVSWSAIADAARYRVELTDGAGTLAASQDVPAGQLTASFSGTPGQTYTVRVYAVGPPSNPQTIAVPTANQILADLRGRLLAQRTQPDPAVAGYQYPLDATVLPDTPADGDPAQVWTTLDAALGQPTGTPLTIEASTDPALTADTLTLTGTSAALTGDPATTVTLTFTVSATLLLQATWLATPSQDWNLADTFDVLAWSPYQYLPLAGPVFAATTYPHQDADFFFPLQNGLSFQATLPVRGDLRQATGLPGETGTQQIRIGGSLLVEADGSPWFTWTGESAAGPLTIARTGQDSLTMTTGTLALSNTAATITGPVTIGIDQVTCTVGLPSGTSTTLTMHAQSPAITQPTTTAALTALGLDDVLGTVLPASLLDLTGAVVDGYTVVFDPAGSEPTQTTATLGFGADAWVLVPSLSLSISGLALDVTVVRASGYGATPLVSYGGEVRGQLSLGGASYAVTAGIPAEGAWYVDITDTSSEPTLAALAGLTGLTAAQVTGVLPSSLLTLDQAFTLSKVSLLADPVTQALDQVGFTIAQTSPWPLAGGLLTVSGWTFDITITGTVTTGLLTGTVSLGGTLLNLTLPVPIGPDAIWTLSLAENGADENTFEGNTTVQIPTIGQVLALLGGDPALLPTGISTLGGLTVNRFAVSVSPDAVTLLHVALGFTQSSDWVIIPNGLMIIGVSAAFAFDPSTNPAGASGIIQGVLVLCNTPVDVTAVKNGFGGGWSLQAAYGDFVHVPGWNDLDAWLNGTEAQTGLPATLPLGDGFDIGAVFLDFAGDASGSLTQFGFSIEVTDLWTVIPGYLSLTDVAGDITLPYPVVASGITGSVSGVVTIGGADIGIEASKPDTGSAWEFTGTLIEGLTLDLVAAAAALTGNAEQVPPDAVTAGLPAAITIESANVQVVPDTGLFHFDGSAGFDWSFQLGGATLSVTSIGGTIDIPETDAPLQATVTGTFDYVGIHVQLALLLGGPAAQAVLAGTLTPANAPAIQIAALTDGITTPASTDAWIAVVPADMSALSFTGAAMYLNLTSQQLMLYGTLACGGGLTAEAFVYLSPAADVWRYAVALAIGPGFRFGDVFSALAVIDAHIQVTATHLVVCDLAGQSLGDLSQATGDLLAAIAPGMTPPLADIAGQPLTLTSGVWFMAEIDFAPTTLFGHILQIGSDATPPVAWLSALIDRASSASSVFTADLPDITILDTIRLTHTDAYPGIHLQYAPAQAGQFDLAGRMELTGIFGSGYQFDVTLTADDTGMTATVQQTSQEIANPFGVPGLVLSGLAVEVSYTWTPLTSSFALSGHVLLGSASTSGTAFSVTARLALLSSKPVLFDLLLDRDFPIGAFLAQCLTGSGANWPSDFIEVTFNAGSRIYYYSAADDPGHTLAANHADGFNVDAQLTLTLITQLSLHAVVSVPPGYTGVRAGIQLDGPLDLIFVALAGDTQAAGAYTGGPLLAFQTGDTPSFALTTGLNFLSAAFVVVQVGVARGSDDGTIFSGRITAAAPLEPFGTLDCGFTYTTRPGREPDFAIEGWPSFGWARDLIDFVQAIKALADTSDGSPCGALADFIVDQAYSSDFSITPSVSASGTTLNFSLTGTYSLTITGTSTPFVSMTFPPFTVPIPATTRWPDLPEALATGFAQASAQFARDLMNQPDKIAMFIAMVCGPRAASVALELVCNSLVDSAVAAAVAEAATAILDVGGAAAAGAAGAASAAISTALAGAGGGGGGSGGGGSGGGGGGGGSGGGGTVVAIAQLRTLSYAGTTLAGSWDAAQGAAAYTFAVARPDGTELTGQDFGMALTGTLTIDSGPLPAGVYHGEVKGTRGSQSGDWSTLPLTKLAGPPVTLSYADPDLVATWQNAAADSYSVAFYDPGGGQLGGIITVPGTELSARLPLPDPLASLYSATVRADLTGQFPGEWASKASLTVLSLPGPAIQTITRSGQGFSVTWTAVPSAASYELRILNGGTVLAAVTSGGTQAAVSVPSGLPASGTAVQVQLRAHGTAGLSPWVSQDFTVLDVPAPASVALTDDAGIVTATWSPVTVVGASVAYDLVLADASGTAGTLTGLTGTAAVPVRADGQPLAEGSVYTVRVRAVASGNNGAETASAELTVSTPPPPTGAVLSAAAAAIRLDWTPPAVAGAVSYDVVLLMGGNEVGAAQGVAAVGVDLARADGRTAAPGEVYTARVRAAQPAHTSAWTDAGPVTIMDTPFNLHVNYGDGATFVVWDEQIGIAVTDEIELIFSGPGGTPMTQTLAATPPLSTAFDMTGQPRGTYQARVRAHAPNSVGAWSEPTVVAVIDPPSSVTTSFDGTQITVSWQPVAGVTGYRVTLNDPSTESAYPETLGGNPPSTTGAFPAPGLPRGVQLSVTVACMIGDLVSADSPPSVIVLPADAPAGVTAHFDGTQVVASWQPVAGAASYQVQFLDPAGRVVASVPASSTSVSYGGAGIIVGVQYQIQVCSVAPGSTWSAPVAVTQDGYTCLCLGTPLGAACTGGGVFTDLVSRVPKAQLEAAYLPSASTGWVGVPPGRASAVAVIAQLIGLLTGHGWLTGTEPFDVFAPPYEVRSMGGGGNLTCLCLGGPGGGGCGNDAIGDNFTGLFPDVTQAQADSSFHPDRTGRYRTGWVTVANVSYTPLEVLAQLVTKLAGHVELPGGEPWNVFNAAAGVTIGLGTGSASDVTCVALGVPVGQACTTMNGHFGDVVLQVAASELSGQYQPGPATGWVSVGSADYHVLTVVVRLVALLYSKSLLTGTEPFDIFNNATAAHSQ